MAAFDVHTDFSLVSAILRKGSGARVVKAALAAGVRTATITSARGTLLRSGFSLRPTISPEREIAHMLVRNDNVDNVLAAFVEEGKLYMSGAGAVFSASVDRAFISPDDPIFKPGEAASVELKRELDHDLVAITCIVQSGMAEDVARAALKVGAPGPTIFFGQGQGLRQKLGLLRIAVSPEKELFETVVGRYDCDKIFEEVVERGRLDTPGMGFIFTRPISKGLINIIGREGTSRHTASMEQMIKAIDDLKHGTEWRSQGSLEVPHTKERTYLENLENVIYVIERGRGEPLVAAAMKAGAPGATISFSRQIGGERKKGATGLDVSSEKEMIQLVVAKDRADEIIEAMLEADAAQGEELGHAYTLAVDRALTYLGPDG